MNSLFDIMMAETEEVASNSAGLLSEVARQSRRLREQLHGTGKIVQVQNVDWSTISETSLCAVDGASAFKQLQSGDQISVGSTLADGQNSLPATTDKQCAYGYMSIRVHTGDNGDVVGSMRAMTEIAVLGDSPHDISIIDGAMLNNYLSVLLALHKNKSTARPILDFLKKDNEAAAFYAGVEKIFKVKDSKDAQGKDKKRQKVIALAKSDSSSTMIKTYLGKDGADLKDKLVASMILEPGEMLTPLPLTSTPLKPGLLESNNAPSLREWNMLEFNKWDLNTLDLADKEIVFKILHMGKTLDQAQDDPDCSVFNQYAYLVGEKHLYFTYYKPSLFLKGEQALRVEFSLPWDSRDALQEIQSILPHLEADIVQGAVKEPFSQYMVDRYAKQAVSDSMNILASRVRMNLDANGEDSFHSMSSYRT